MAPPPSSSNSDEMKPEESSHAAVKPNIIKRLWAKTGLEKVFVIMMLRGAIPPIIALASYQATPWAQQYTTLGYLVAIMTMLSLPFQPRAKFMQSMIITLLFVCCAAAVSLLQIRCTTAARESATTETGTTYTGASGSAETVQYNASASAVAALFLFVLILIPNTVRAYRPTLQLPSIIYSIFIIVAATYSPQFPNMATGTAFVRRLLITFLTGFGIATGVSLFVFPMTSRKMVLGQMAGLAGLLKGVLDAHGEYMRSLTDELEGKAKSEDRGEKEAKKLKGLVLQCGQMFSKIKLELSFARKELAYGHLCSEDFSEIFKRFKALVLPAIGLSTYLEIINSTRGKKKRAADKLDSDAMNALCRLETDEWDEILSMSHEPFADLKKALVAGLDHFCYDLKIIPRPNPKIFDEERGAADSLRPGEKGFADKLERKVKEFHARREQLIQEWCTKKGITLPATYFDGETKSMALKTISTEGMRKKENQHQLYLILYTEFLIHAMAKAIIEMVRFGDSKTADGTMRRKQIVNPGWRRLRKLFLSAFCQSDAEDSIGDQQAGPQVWVGDGLKGRRDPEHLEPKTTYQRWTNYLRVIPRVLSSPQAAFGFRAAVATLSIGIIAYLRQTAHFFLEQRGLWALIMVAISMGSHAGFGIFGFGARIIGTLVAAVVTLALWYIGDRISGAVLPLLFIYLLGGFWFLVTHPTLSMVGMISMVTGILTIGYELQAEKVGRAVAASNGQPYYDMYLLAPYRLVVVIVGLATAFIWTYFPYPVTTHTTLRRDLGRTMHLLANYYSVVHSTVDIRLQGHMLPPQPDKTSPVAKLDKARAACLQKTLMMLSRLREHSGFTRYEPTFGGKFPKRRYDALIDSMTKIFDYLSLIAYSANAFVEGGDPVTSDTSRSLPNSSSEKQSNESAWLRDFRHFTLEVNITSHEITSILCLVSASITNAQPLPPYIYLPQPYDLASKMQAIDPDILSIKHLAEPCYSAFAVLEITSTLLTEEMAVVVDNVRELVGEVNFEFHIVDSTEKDSSSKVPATKNEGKQA